MAGRPRSRGAGRPSVQGARSALRAPPVRGVRAGPGLPVAGQGRARGGTPDRPQIGVRAL